MLRFAACFLLAISCFLLGSCQVNRYKDGLRTGLWVTGDDSGDFKSRGRYKKDRERGTWKYFYNDTLYQKDRYSGNNARVKFYHPNKKIRASGKTSMDYNGKMAHWYYNGDWKYFDTGGKLLKTVTYEKGTPVAEVSSGNPAKETTIEPATIKRTN